MRSGAELLLTVGMPEKFIEKALEMGVCIRSCRRIDDGRTQICVADRDVPQLQALAERYGVGCELTGRHGISALAEALLRRRSVLAGVIAMLCTAALLLSRVWMVRVRPVDATDPAVLEKAQRVLAEAGAAPGAAAWSLDRAWLRARLISEIPEAGYVAVKRMGVCLVAEISGAVEPPEIYDIGAARDIVAMHDGVVQRVDVFAGTAAVEPGATVRRGDVLILGQERTSGELPEAVSAEGVVMARIWQTAQVQQPLTEQALLPTGNIAVTEELRLPGVSLPLSGGAGFSHEQVQTEFLPVGGLFVPVGILRSTHIECAPQQRRRDEAEVKRLLLEEAEAILDENMPFGARVIDKWEDYSMIDSGTLYMKLTRELEADIAASGRTAN